MSFAVPENYVIGDRQKDMVRIVAQRLALALENARLIEQSRAQAEREHTASEVSNLLIGQQDLNALLDVAAESFNERLIDDRNRVMAARIAPLLRDGGAFVAIGAAHLPGEGGVLARLTERGYSVTREY